ncbi:hypothetical protein BT96DRAFT_984345 [Gymnopus androsaceus JB14]|uniref:DUF6589 domain-containing protein n=1 Tax=Gymnopus androsaceus JB14 TaxID=1447944 RepID=A0A6A4IH96_9AGAR|nr:hypothetical protein BT96DRAFT_984345 [Gymnopus androsaceus JB14]
MIKDMRTRAGVFIGYRQGGGTDLERFAPGAIYKLWHTKFTKKVRTNLHTHIAQPCANEIATEESNKIVNDKQFKIRISGLTIKSLTELLSPDAIMTAYKESAPFTWEFLLIWATSENEYQKKQQQKRSAQDKDTEMEETEGDESDWDYDPNLDEAQLPKKKQSGYGAYTRNSVLVITAIITMLAYTKNTGTNAMPLMLGLFFKINGVSTRVLTMLSNIGLSVSGHTVERVKERLSEDAIQLAIQLVMSGNIFGVNFDNINVYNAKDQQRVTNKNHMIHTTNTVLIGPDMAGIDIDAAEDLSTKLAMQGKREAATFKDIAPTTDDDEHIAKAGRNMIADLIVRNCPGSKEWPNRKEMLDKLLKEMPQDRLLPVTKTITRPIGVFDINEGSKKGIVKMLEAIPKRLQQSFESCARNDRTDDINAMHRLEYIEELSQLFHFALNATHMLMRTHFGNANASTYDEPRVCQKRKSWSQLQQWRPKDLEEVKILADKIYLEFATATAAKSAKAKQDDYAAHDIYFIRDALLFMEFEQAVSHADAGRVVRVLKYWCFAFRGAGQHNYARECAEILLQWKYKTTAPIQAVLERLWFVNRRGKFGGWIAADLYLEHLNYWVKCVFIATGNDRAREHKEVKYQEDLRVLVEEMLNKKVHPTSSKPRFVPAPIKVSKAKKLPKKKSPPKSAIFDIEVAGASIWLNGKLDEYLRTTTFDPSSGYPMEDVKDADAEFTSDSIFDSTANPIGFKSYEDLPWR